MSSKPIPVVICGRLPEIASPVAEGLKPEYEVIDVIYDLEIARTHLPALLRQGTSAAAATVQPASTVGTHDFSRAPQVLLVGAAFDPAEIEELRDIARSVRPVLTLRANPPPAGFKPTPDMFPQIGGIIAARAKEVLGKVVAEGGLDKDAELYY